MTSLRTPLFVLAIAGVSSTYGCKSDDSSDTGSDEHGMHDHGAETTTSASTTATTTGTTGDHDHGAETTSGGHDHNIDTDADDPVVAYCMCVFANCHEPYHMKWGEDEMMAEEACLMEAQGLPQNGGPIEMGNFLECRQHFCDEAATDPSVCTNALGDAVCI